MLVIKVACNESTGKYKVFEDSSQAERFWARLIVRVVEVIERYGGVTKAEMFNVDETNAVAARGAVIAEKAKRLKSSKISAPRSLRGKVPPFGAVVDAEVLKKAQKIIDDLKDDFIIWASEDLDELFRCLKILKNGDGDNKDVLVCAFKAAYQISGRGSTFGYDLVSKIGTQLCKVIQAIDDVSSADIKAIQVHVDAMKVIVVQQIEGDGGAFGEEVIKGLNDVLERTSSGNGN